MRLITGCYFGIATGLVAMASLEGMLVSVQNEFVLSVDDLNVLVLVFAAGSLLILFAAGALVDRLGSRTVLTAGAAIVTVGAVTVALAGDFGWLVAGRVAGGIGGTSMSVACLALINATVTADRERAYVFGVFAAVIGVVAAVSPVFGGVIARDLTWRLVPVGWILVAAAAVALVGGASLSGREEHGRREFVTPVSAGVVLSATCLAALAAKPAAPLAAVALAVAVLALVVLVRYAGRLRSRGVRPTLDVSLFRTPGAGWLMAALLTVGFVNLFFYVNLFLQYRVGMTAPQAAALLIVPQVAGILGGLAGGWVSARIGSQVTTAVALGVGCVAALGFLTLSTGSATAQLIVLAAIFASAGGCIVGTLTKAFLDCADVDASGAAASWRQAGWSVGATLGGVASGAVVLGYFSATWSASLRDAGVPAPTADWAAEAVRSGLPLSEVAASPLLQGVPAREAVQGFVGLAQAQVDTLRLVAVLAAVAYTVSLAFVLAAMWRRRLAGHG